MESELAIADYFKMPLSEVRNLTVFEVGEIDKYMRKIARSMKK